MSTDLREELTALAETQTFAPDPSAWDRGRRARRNARIGRGAAALAVVAIVVGVGAVAMRPSPVGPADGVVPQGAIPSRIAAPGGEVLTDLAIGSASVAYVDSDDRPVLVDARTGEAHWVELPDFPDTADYDAWSDNRRGPWLALSPDGRRLVYPTAAGMTRTPDSPLVVYVPWYRTVDLTTGTSELVDVPPYGTTPLAMSWTADGRIATDAFDKGRIDTPVPDVIGWTIDPATAEAVRSPQTGLVSPDGRIAVPFPEELSTVDAVRFVTSDGEELSRPIPTDAFPGGAPVMPVGWADDDLLVAQVGTDVVLLTSPDRPEAEWVWRTIVDEVDHFGFSIAVDLVPDLTGEPDQELTHDFAAASERDISWIIGLGVAAAIAVLMALRWLWRRLLGR